MKRAIDNGIRTFPLIGKQPGVTKKQYSIFFPIIVLIMGAAAVYTTLSPFFDTHSHLSAAGLPTPSATPPTSACALTCNITTQRYGFGISCETGQVSRKGTDSTHLEYGLDKLGQIAVSSAEIDVNQTLTYADSKNSYTITGKIRVKPLANTVAYDIRATGGVFGDKAQGCRSGVMSQSSQSPTAPPSTIAPTVSGKISRTPDLADLAAATLAQRWTMTAQAAPSSTPTPAPSLTLTPNLEQTLSAMVAATVTALAGRQQNMSGTAVAATKTANAIIATQEQNMLGTMVAATETALANTPTPAGTATPAPGVQAGSWAATVQGSDFKFTFEVSPGGSGLNNFTYYFAPGMCGSGVRPASINIKYGGDRPITNRAFSFRAGLSSGGTVSTNGNFARDGKSASGSFSVNCGGGIVSGSWTATATNTVTAATPTPVSSEKTLFADTFDKGLQSPWQYDAQVSKVIKDGDNNVLSLTSSGQWTNTTLSIGSSWTDYALEARIKILKGTTGDTPDITFKVRVTSSGDYSGWLSAEKYWPGLGRYTDTWTGLSDGIDFITGLNTWHTIRLEITGQNLSLKVDGRLLATAADAIHTYGTIGFTMAPDAQAYVDDVKVIDLQR